MKFNFLLLAFFLCSIQSAYSQYDESVDTLSSQEVENLSVFTEIYNCVRYFYPSKAVRSIDWDKFAIYGVREVQGCENKSTLMDQLEKLFLPLCSELKIDSLPLSGGELYPLNRKGRKIFIHTGSGEAVNIGGFIGLLYKIVDKKYIHTKVKSLTEKDSLYWYNDHIDGVYFSMPTAAVSGKKADYKQLKSAVDTISIVQLTKVNKEWKPFVNVNLRSHRLAGIIIAWGNFRHFYAYNDLITIDWNTTLKTALKEVVKGDYIDYYYSLCKMLASLNDGHIRVLMSGSKGIYGFSYVGWQTQISFKNINDTILVDNGNSTVPKGSMITSFNGIRTEDWLNSSKNYISASPQYKRVRSGHDFLTTYYPKKDSVFQIIYDTPTEKNKTATLDICQFCRELGDTSAFVQKNGDTYLFKFGSVKATAKELHKTLKAVSKDESVDGVIFDLRNSAFMDDRFLGYLTDSTLQSAFFKIPVVKYPKEKQVNYNPLSFKVKPKKGRIKIPVVFIIDGSILSYGESVMGIVEHYKLGAIVGEPTAGINGDTRSLSIPVHWIRFYTGLRTDKHDGSPLFCVGVLPTHPVQQTAKDFMNGRDALLEKAMDIIKEK